MNDMQISKDLALAIGWKESQMRVTVEFGFQVACEPPRSCWTSPWWRGFDYRDPTVIWPIAVHYHAFPYKLKFPASIAGKWNCFLFGKGDQIADTPEKAIALAVIHGTGN